MSRSEMLTKLAMELAEWLGDAHTPTGFCFNGLDHIGYKDTGDVFTKTDWLTERDRLISKPSWDYAPADAEWLAQDSGGAWYWYEDIPERLNASWAGPAILRQSPIQGALPAGHDWRETLEQRPVLEAHTEPEWDGESWPPPINMMCEYRGTENSEWRQGMCVGNYNGYAVVVDWEDDISAQMVEHVRPLRTAEQREEEELAQKISDFYSSRAPEEYLCLARELIRDGYRKDEETLQ